MAITIRNKETEALIRKIGRRTGEGPSAVITRLVTNEAGGKSRLPPDVVKGRVARIRELRDRYKHPDDPKLTREEAEREMNAIFGEH